MHLEIYNEFKRGSYKLKRKNKRLQGQKIKNANSKSILKMVSSLILVGVFIASIIAVVVMGFGSFGDSVYSKQTMPRARAEKNERDYKSMAVIESSSMRILSCYNETVKLPMASTTKIMTAILTIEHFHDLSEKFKVPDSAVGIEGTSIYLKKGEILSIEEYLYGLMLPSANDCAVALSIIISGSEGEFSKLMNKKARELGLNSTNFVTASGLHDKEHYTTSEDLAKLSAYAMKNEKFRKIVETPKITIRGSEENKPRQLKNKQKLMQDEELLKLGVKVNGVKSGFTPEAGRCLVTSANHNGMEVIIVVLNAPNMFESTAKILKEIYEEYRMEEIVIPKKHITTLPVLDGVENNINIYSSEGFSYPLTREEKARIKVIYDYPNYLVAPIAKDQQVGELKITLFDEVIKVIPILSIEEVKIEDFELKFKKLIKGFIG